MIAELRSTGLAIALATLALAMALSFVRVAWGPTVPDRVLALDLVANAGAGLMAGAGIAFDDATFLDVALVLVVAGFVASAGFAQLRRPRQARMSALLDLAITTLALLGAALIVISAIGVLRMPDLYSRLHAASKAPTLGLACLALALVLHFDDSTVWFRAAALGFVMFVTAPISAHLIGRAGFLSGVPLANDYVVDETEHRR